jgi:Flp pilus assembly protein TadD
MGRLREAVQTLEKARAVAGDVPNLLGALGQAHAYAGNTAEARILLSKLDDLSRSSYVPSTARAMIHIGLGEHARALDWLETACNRRELPLCAIAVHPGYDPLRGEPRFAALLARIGLAQ